jgi:hypothetical protein
MSRRYGRNQRRRAREALAAADERIGNLETAMKMDRALLARQRGEIQRSEDFQREVAEIVGREAIIAGVPVRMSYSFQRYGDSIEFVPRQPFSAIALLNSVEHTHIKAVRRETLHLLDVDVVADQLRHQIQARVKLAGSQAGYAISTKALIRMPEKELVPRIAEEIAVLLVRDIKGKIR